MKIKPLSPVIEILPEYVIDQIKAGEVIETPGLPSQGSSGKFH